MARRAALASICLLLAGVVGAVPSASPLVAPASAQTPGGTRSIPASGTTSIRSLPAGAEGLQQPELRQGRSEESEGAAERAADAQVGVFASPTQGHAGEFNRPRPGSGGGDPFPPEPLDPPVVRSSRLAPSDAALSVAGLNHRDQRLANGGNQFSLEPPDQALCVGNGFVLEATNGAVRVFDTSGAPVTGVQDLNTFFRYPAAIDRTATPPVIGPQTIDPVCLYDADVDRFVVVITTLHTLPDGTFTGRNTIDVAVSNTGDPTGEWTVYYVPAQNDGTEGTPDHGCSDEEGEPGPCFQDYPHVGADRNGIYVSTNEYDLFGSGYNAAQLFAFSKRELAAHGTVRVTLVENLRVAGTPGFTVWPALSPPGEASREGNGTEYFLSTIAGDGSETGNPTRSARKIGVWALSNTRSLDSPTPSLRLSSRLIDSEKYVFPPLSTQPDGPFPLGECINDTTIPTQFGPGCWNLIFTEEPAHDEVISTPDSSDTRMQQTWYVSGQLWGAASTAVEVNGEVKAGIAWFRVEPWLERGGRVGARVERQGYLALADNNLTYPAIALTSEGEGAIAFSVMGEDFYPSAGYVRIDDRGRVGPVQVVAEGQGVTDGFTSYRAFNSDPAAPPRTRWGDYGAAVTDGEDIWLASEYIAQSCTLEEWLAGSIGSCGGTRTALANWATRLTRLDT